MGKDTTFLFQIRGNKNIFLFQIRGKTPLVLSQIRGKTHPILSQISGKDVRMGEECTERNQLYFFTMSFPCSCHNLSFPFGIVCWIYIPAGLSAYGDESSRQSKTTIRSPTSNISIRYNKNLTI